MKKGMITLMIAVAATFSINAVAQSQPNINNQYGPPNYTGGTVNTPSESFAVYQQERASENPATLIESISPDPTKNVSSVTLTEMAVNPVTLYIVNLNGTIVKTYNYNGGNNRLVFDVSDLQDGVYNIQVQEKGKSMQSIKLLKQS